MKPHGRFCLWDGLKFQWARRDDFVLSMAPRCLEPKSYRPITPGSHRHRNCNNPHGLVGKLKRRFREVSGRYSKTWYRSLQRTRSAACSATNRSTSQSPTSKARTPSPKKRGSMRTAVAWRCTHKGKDIKTGDPATRSPVRDFSAISSGLLVIPRQATTSADCASSSGNQVVPTQLNSYGTAVRGSDPRRHLCYCRNFLNRFCGGTDHI